MNILSRYVFPLLLVFYVTSPLQGAALPPFYGTITTIPAATQTQMRKYTWHAGCPVPLSELRYLTLSYYGYDHAAHRGILIVNAELAESVLAIFKGLYQQRFPIYSMIPMFNFKGNDEASMEANNTSSFNCRQVTGHPGIYSQHSYGRAIDLNTRVNPYVAGTKVLPQNGKVFISRCKSAQGKVVQDNLPYRLFTENRFDWGGSWYDIHDYQHFEKRENNALRDPFGYDRILLPVSQ